MILTESTLERDDPLTLQASLPNCTEIGVYVEKKVPHVENSILNLKFYRLSVTLKFLLLRKINAAIVPISKMQLKDLINDDEIEKP